LLNITVPVGTVLDGLMIFGWIEELWCSSCSSRSKALAVLTLGESVDGFLGFGCEKFIYYLPLLPWSTALHFLGTSPLVVCVLWDMQLTLWAACVCVAWNLGFRMLNSAELRLCSLFSHFYTNLPSGITTWHNLHFYLLC
jgi:hypothetical protein